jgi:hypothetical protein
MHPKIDFFQSFEPRLIFEKKYQYSFWIDFFEYFLLIFQIENFNRISWAQY